LHDLHFDNDLSASDGFEEDRFLVFKCRFSDEAFEFAERRSKGWFAECA
jgi:hypothetical protein